MNNNDVFTSRNIGIDYQRLNRDERWLANYEALKAYIDEHHHLPPKNAPLGAKFLL